MTVIYVDKKSGIPIVGIGFIGIIDRGRNVIEIYLTTICNLKCKFCYVSSGDYDTNFIVDLNYLVEKVNDIIEIKGNYDIEIFLTARGDALLYPELFELIEKLRKIEGVEIITLVSNGLLLSKNIIKKLEEINLTRLNVSLYTFNKELANYLSNCRNYNMKKLLENIQFLLDSNIDILISAIWIPRKNDKDIIDVIKFVINLRNKGYSEKKIQIGIMKYIVYPSGRKLRKKRPVTWSYFYKQLSVLEKKYNIKLILGPEDFGIQKRNFGSYLNVKNNDLIKLKIISKGRYKREWIGKISEDIGFRVLFNWPYTFPDNIIGKEIIAKVINHIDNLSTNIAVLPIHTNTIFRWISMLFVPIIRLSNTLYKRHLIKSKLFYIAPV